MPQSYSDPKFGVEQMFVTDRTGSLVGTFGVTEVFRYTFKKACLVTAVYARYGAAGTAADQNFHMGRSLAGTGTTVQLGTSIHGTQAVLTVKDLSFTGTFAANDDIVFSKSGTGTEVTDVEFQVFYQELFDNS